MGRRIDSFLYWNLIKKTNILGLLICKFLWDYSFNIWKRSSENIACRTRSHKEVPSKTRACHGWSRCNGINYTVYSTCMVSGSEIQYMCSKVRHVKIASAPVVTGSGFLCKDPEYFWDSAALFSTLSRF